VTLTDVVVAALKGAGIATGDGIAKDGAVDLAPPYVVVYPWTATYDGPVTDRNADGEPAIQIKAVGKTRGAAENVGVEARAVMLGALASPTGQQYSGAPSHELGRGVLRDDSTTPPLFYADDVYRYYLTPA
jgi:hypothetical protein